MKNVSLVVHEERIISSACRETQGTSVDIWRQLLPSEDKYGGIIRESMTLQKSVTRTNPM